MCLLLVTMAYCAAVNMSFPLAQPSIDPNPLVALLPLLASFAAAAAAAASAILLAGLAMVQTGTTRSYEKNFTKQYMH